MISLIRAVIVIGTFGWLGCGEIETQPQAVDYLYEARNPVELELQAEVPSSAVAEELMAVPYVDVDRYLGTWYEMASIPNWFQSYCRQGVRAQYALEVSGSVEVRNSCIDDGGIRNELVGRALIYDAEAASRLQVAFFGIDPAEIDPNYWILYLEEDYSLVVVGEPERNFGWILSRSPAISQSRMTTAAELLLRNGYDLNDFELTDQSFYIEGRETTTVVSYQ